MQQIYQDFTTSEAVRQVKDIPLPSFQGYSSQIIVPEERGYTTTNPTYQA